MMRTAKRQGRRGLVLIVCLVLAALVAGPAHAKSNKKQNLVDLLTHAESIVVGTVTGKSDGFEQGLPYTEVTLDVGRSLRGQHGETYTFRQFGLIEPRATGDGRVNLMVTPVGWPTYVEGESVMLFLHAPASKTGFQTTAGLDQGKFTFRGDSVINGNANQDLFEGVTINRSLTAEQRDLVTRHGGAFNADDFVSLIEVAVQERWVETGGMTND